MKKNLKKFLNPPVNCLFQHNKTNFHEMKKWFIMADFQPFYWYFCCYTMYF